MSTITNFNPGDVIWADLGKTKGHEQEGKRPAIVVSCFPQHKLVIIIPITTKDKGWWMMVRLPKEESHLKEDSFALCHQIRSISMERVDYRTGKISSTSLAKVKTVLTNVLQLG
jgi:mRNA interferase MazF